MSDHAKMYRIKEEPKHGDSMQDRLYDQNTGSWMSVETWMACNSERRAKPPRSKGYIIASRFVACCALVVFAALVWHVPRDLPLFNWLVGLLLLWTAAAVWEE